jgi:hypothetical protein
MESETKAPPSAQIFRHHSIEPALAVSLAQELKRCGFTVVQGEEQFGQQQAADWALPAFTTLILSAASAGGVLVFKKFADGFLEDMGVKNAGSRVSQTLKMMFSTVLDSDIAYYTVEDLQRMARKEPLLDSSARKPHPIRLTLNLGGKDIVSPPWGFQFLFTRDIGEDFENALASIPRVVERMGDIRDFVWQNFVIKLSDLDRYYEVPHHRSSDGLIREIINNVDATGGFFLYDNKARLWVKAYSGPWSCDLGALLDSALRKAGITVSR